MKKNSFVKLLITFFFIISFVVSMFIYYTFQAPIYQIRKAFQHTFSSIDDCIISPFWSESSLATAYDQEATLALKDCSMEDFPMSSYLGGLQLHTTTQLDSNSGSIHGSYQLAYSAMPITNGKLVISDSEIALNAPSLIDGSFTLSMPNPFPMIFQLQPQIHQLYDTFYDNKFDRLSNHTLLQTQDNSYNCTQYQIVLNDTSRACIDDILSIFKNSSFNDYSSFLSDKHPEIHILSEQSLTPYDTITLLIDSDQYIRQIQYTLSDSKMTYYYTLTLTGMETPLSSYSFSMIATDNLSHTVLSYCQLIEEESSCAIYAQEKDSSVIHHIALTTDIKNGYLHTSSIIDYSYACFHTTSMQSLEDILTGIDPNVPDQITPWCTGQMQYYISTNPSKHQIDLNMESLSCNLPDYNTSFILSLRYSQEACDILNTDPIDMDTPIYELEHLLEDDFMDTLKERIHLWQ